MTKKYLLVIIILAAFLRFYKLASFPVSLYWDEAAIGYNAFSIAKTGHDEYGRKFPLLFQSFNDYKLPGYIYTDSIFIKVFDLSEFWVRFPSALFGTFAVLLIYLLNRKIFNENIALASAFLLAISPWHLQFSRAAFEANAALTLVVLGIVLIFYGFRNKIAAMLSLPILFLSFYFYHSPRIFVPAILLTIAFLYRKEIAKNAKAYIVGLVVGAILIIPILVQIVSPQGMKRVGEVSLFSDRSIIEPYVLIRESVNIPSSAIFLNRRIPLAFEILHSYFSHFSPGFLFFGDDPNPRQKSALHGNLYLVEIPLLLAGLWMLLKQKDNKSKLFIVAWLLVAPIPAGLAREFPHSLRALLMLPALVTLSAIGFTSAFRIKFAKLIIPIVFSLSIINYLFTYYVVSPQTSSASWAYGYEQAFVKVAALEGDYDRVIFTGNYWKPYIFYLFYNKVDPGIFAKSRSETELGKYRFGVAAWDGGKNFDNTRVEELKSGKTLVVLSPQEFSTLMSGEKLKSLQTIYDFAGTNEIFKIGQWQ
ncbi:MAG: glycosyltransferase family 39 protein [Candidatus Curtissbacteria bacterium]|nr:glycosyltransferase family 39 protein [Candidatus Curtissbacteria bacterium]